MRSSTTSAWCCADSVTRNVLSAGGGLVYDYADFSAGFVFYRSLAR